MDKTTTDSTDKPRPLVNLYKVKNWDSIFEGAKSKTYNNKTSCMMPTKHGLGYKRLVRRKNGAAMFGAWCALIQVLSRHEKKRNGYCTGDGKVHGSPYTADDLEILTDIPAKYYKELFPVAQSVGWLDLIQVKDTTGDQQDTVGIPQESIVPLNSDSNLDSNLDLDSNSTPSGGGSRIKIIDEITGTCLDCEEFRNAWDEWAQHRREIKKTLTVSTAKKQIKKLDGLGLPVAIATISHTIEKGWIGLVVPVASGSPQGNRYEKPANEKRGAGGIEWKVGKKL
jgi:hypothetical protein